MTEEPLVPELPEASLVIDQTVQQYLYITYRWAKFLAVFGIVVCAVLLLSGIIFCIKSNSSTTTITSSVYYRYTKPQLGVTKGVTYIIISILHFFPSLFLLQFANKMKNALLYKEQLLLNESFRRLKKLFNYMGGLIIAVILIYASVFFFLILKLMFR